MTLIETLPEQRLCQGDVIRNVVYLESLLEANGNLQANQILFPAIVVLTQDCDLEEDYRIRQAGERKDKLLLSVLVAPLFNEDHFLTGTHLSELGLNADQYKRNKSDYRAIQSNQKPRFHFLDFPSSAPIVPSIVDFKHYFSVSRDYLTERKSADFVCKLAPLHREQLSHRFAFFLSRIGLPTPEADDHLLPTKQT